MISLKVRSDGNKTTSTAEKSLTNWKIVLHFGVMNTPFLCDRCDELGGAVLPWPGMVFKVLGIF